MHLGLPLLVALVGAVTTITASVQEAQHVNPLPNYYGSNPEGDHPEGLNPTPAHPEGTKPCGTYATTATDGPCGAWFLAQYTITSTSLPPMFPLPTNFPVFPQPTTFTTTVVTISK